ncbi:MAG: hypothetical protein Sylvanvirus4_39 [Sylvanvirus sp.]|uniref:Uncharacterized protein n=1 Tax=Sylvanvirus sp. TaxID=2487774 RepID=A0A3G5AHE0_9VIRU|nr:MAG: hypothetical protein Sylvanvirus4_39 [Sylvanvirus sp.]
MNPSAIELQTISAPTLFKAPVTGDSLFLNRLVVDGDILTRCIQITSCGYIHQSPQLHSTVRVNNPCANILLADSKRIRRHQTIRFTLQCEDLFNSNIPLISCSDIGLMVSIKRGHHVNQAIVSLLNVSNNDITTDRTILYFFLL